MSTDSAPDVQLEIGHVLFMDVVGYSKLLINDQRELQEQLSEIVRGTNCFRSAEAAGRLIRLPVGDGMALVFFHSPEAPVQCAIEISKALKNAEKAFELARPAFEAQVKEAPDSADRHANLGWCCAFMGRKEDAIREGRRAVELKPESADAFDGAIMNCYLALIYAHCGEKDLAIPLIERLLKTPGAVDSVVYSITVNDLKYRWEWAPIRNDLRFQKLVNAKP